MILCCVSRVFKLEIVQHYIQETRDISLNNKQEVFQLWDRIYKIRDISVNNIQVGIVEVYVMRKIHFALKTILPENIRHA